MVELDVVEQGSLDPTVLDEVAHDQHGRLRRFIAVDFCVAVLAVAFAFVVARWALQLWRLGFEAGPVIAMFEAEAGRQLSGSEWYDHDQARAVFCSHAGADPATSPIGRFIDGSPMYLPSLAPQMAGVLVGSGLLRIGAHWARGDATRRWTTITGVVAVVVALIPLLVHRDVISILTWVTE